MKKTILLSVLLAALMMSACQPAAPTITAPEATGTTAPAATVAATAAPTEIPLPTLSPEQQAVFDQLQPVWQPVINGSLINQLVCPMIQATAQGVLDDTIDAKQAMTEILGQGMLLYAINSAYTDWQPDPAVADFKEQVVAQATVLQGVLDRWSKSEISEDEIVSQLEETCPGTKTTTEEILAAARDAGMTKEMFDQMVADLDSFIGGIMSVE